MFLPKANPSMQQDPPSVPGAGARLSQKPSSPNKEELKRRFTPSHVNPFSEATSKSYHVLFDYLQTKIGKGTRGNQSSKIAGGNDPAPQLPFQQVDPSTNPAYRPPNYTQPGWFKQKETPAANQQLLGQYLENFQLELSRLKRAMREALTSAAFQQQARRLSTQQIFSYFGMFERFRQQIQSAFYDAIATYPHPTIADERAVLVAFRSLQADLLFLHQHLIDAFSDVLKAACYYEQQFHQTQISASNHSATLAAAAVFETTHTTPLSAAELPEHINQLLAADQQQTSTSSASASAARRLTAADGMYLLKCVHQVLQLLKRDKAAKAKGTTTEENLKQAHRKLFLHFKPHFVQAFDQLHPAPEEEAPLVLRKKKKKKTKGSSTAKPGGTKQQQAMQDDDGKNGKRRKRKEKAAAAPEATAADHENLAPVPPPPVQQEMLEAAATPPPQAAAAAPQPEVVSDDAASSDDPSRLASSSDEAETKDEPDTAPSNASNISTPTIPPNSDDAGATVALPDSAAVTQPATPFHATTGKAAAVSTLASPEPGVLSTNGNAATVIKKHPLAELLLAVETELEAYQESREKGLESTLCLFRRHFYYNAQLTRHKVTIAKKLLTHCEAVRTQLTGSNAAGSSDDEHSSNEYVDRETYQTLCNLLADCIVANRALEQSGIKKKRETCRQKINTSSHFQQLDLSFSAWHLINSRSADDGHFGELGKLLHGFSEQLSALMPTPLLSQQRV